MVVLILTTVPDEASGEALARTLVEERLAACVNLHGPMTSLYRWNGAVEREVERQLIIKTTSDRIPAVEARVRQLHSYDVPEFLVVPVATGGATYLSWIGEQTRAV